MAEAGPSALLASQGPEVILVCIRDYTSRSGRGRLPRSRRKAWTMKHIAGTALAAGCLALVGAALLAGKGDIRKFHRMRSM
jgi:hypothetical protein